MSGRILGVIRFISIFLCELTFLSLWVLGSEQRTGIALTLTLGRRVVHGRKPLEIEQ